MSSIVRRMPTGFENDDESVLVQLFWVFIQAHRESRAKAKLPNIYSIKAL